MRKRNKLFGVGVNDADYAVRWRDENGKCIWCPYYKVWYKMMGRCYDEKYHITRPTYAGCSVSDKWLKFTEFKKWMVEQKWQGNELDKDLLNPCNKVYSPENCVFIPQKLNSFISNAGKIRGEHPLGVTFDKTRSRFLSRCCDGKGNHRHIGYFDCPEEAHEAYREYKHKLACKYADEQTDPRIAHALRQWYKPNGWYLIKETN